LEQNINFKKFVKQNNDKVWQTLKIDH
jgi:hypothetical protein